jgi:hypothetical protein
LNPGAWYVKSEHTTAETATLTGDFHCVNSPIWADAQMRTARYREAKGDKPMNNTSTQAHPVKRAEGAVNRCHCCGATAYKTLIARDAAPRANMTCATSP